MVCGGRKRIFNYDFLFAVILFHKGSFFLLVLKITSLHKTAYKEKVSECLYPKKYFYIRILLLQTLYLLYLEC